MNSDNCFPERFRDRGVREHDLADIRYAHLRFHHDGGRDNELTRSVADGMNSQDLAEPRAGKHLYHSGAAFVLHQEPSGHRHGHDGLLVLNPHGLEFLFGPAHRGHFGMRVYYGWNRHVANSVLLAEHVVDGYYAFARGGVGQHAASGDVSAGPKARHIGLAEVGSLHALGSEIDAQFFEAQAFDHRRAPSRVQDAIGRSARLRTVGGLVTNGVAFDAEHLRGEVE